MQTGLSAPSPLTFFHALLHRSSQVPSRHLVFPPPSYMCVPGFVKQSFSARSVAHDRQPTDPNANEDPLDDVLNRLHRLNKKQRKNTQKGFATKPKPGRDNKSHHQDARSKHRGKSSGAPAGSSSSIAPASTSPELPSSSPAKYSSSPADNSGSPADNSSSPESPDKYWFVPIRSLTPEKPAPSQESIDATIEAVMSMLNLERPSQRRVKAAAATLPAQQEQPKQELAQVVKEQSSKDTNDSQARRDTSTGAPPEAEKPEKGGKGSSDEEWDDLFDEINLMSKDERGQLFSEMFQSVTGPEGLLDNSSDDENEEPIWGRFEAQQAGSSSKAAEKPSQESIDATIEAVMANLKLEKPSPRQAGATAANPSAQQEQPEQKPALAEGELGARKKKDSSTATPSEPKKPMKGGKYGSSKEEQDDLLFDEINLTKDERSQLFDRVFQSVTGLEGLEDDSSDDDEEPSGRRAAQQAGSSKATGSKGPKGFGLPPSAKTSEESPSSRTAAATSGGSGDTRQPFPIDGSVPRLPVFLYCAEVAKTNDAIRQLGLEQHVEVVDALKRAKAVLSVKTGRGGRQKNLQQGKRTANNLGIPFVCVGRRMNPETLLPSIAQLLLDHRAKYGRGVGPEGSNQDELTSTLMSAAEAARKQVQLQPGWAQQMVADLGMFNSKPSAKSTVEPSAKSAVEPSAESAVEPSASAESAVELSASTESPMEPSAESAVKPSASTESPMEPSAESAVKPSASTMTAVELSAESAAVEPSAESAVELSAGSVVELEPSAESAAELAVEPSAESAVGPSAEPSGESAVEPLAEPSPGSALEPSAEPSAESTAQSVVEPSAQTAAEPSAESAAESAVESVVEPSTGSTVQSAVEPSAEPSAESAAQSVVEPPAESAVEPAVDPSAEFASKSAAELISRIRSRVRSRAIEPSAEPSAESAMEPSAKSALKQELSVDPAVDPSAVSAVKPSAESAAEPAMEPSARPSAGSAVEPSAESADEPSAESAAESAVERSAMSALEQEPSADPAVKPSTESAAEPAMEPSAGPSAESAGEPSAESADKPSAEPSAESAAESAVEHSAKSVLEQEPSADPAVKPPTESAAEPAMEPSKGPSAEPSAESAADPAVEPSAPVEAAAESLSPVDPPSAADLAASTAAADQPQPSTPSASQYRFGRLSWVEDYKAALLDTFLGTQRGLTATSEVRAKIDELIIQLETKNPMPNPTEDLAQLDGRWDLVYTSNSGTISILALDQILPLVTVGDIFQRIDTSSGTVENQISIKVLVGRTAFSAKSHFEVSSPKRLQLKLEEGKIQTPELGIDLDLLDKLSILGQPVDMTPLKQVLNPVTNTMDSVFGLVNSVASQAPQFAIPIPSDGAQTWQLNTFLDKDMRISRGDGGKIFVYCRHAKGLGRS